MKPDSLKMIYVLTIVVALAVVILSIETTFAATPTWTDVELANSVAHEG